MNVTMRSQEKSNGYFQDSQRRGSLKERVIGYDLNQQQRANSAANISDSENNGQQSSGIVSSAKVSLFKDWQSILHVCTWNKINDFFFFFSFFLFFIFIFSWKLITLQYCSGFCHTLTWISHGYTCIPHPDPPSHLPLHPIPLGLPSAPGLSTCLMHPTWAGGLFHPR